MYCDHSFESAQRADSNEWSQDMVYGEIRKVEKIQAYKKFVQQAKG